MTFIIMLWAFFLFVIAFIGSLCIVDKLMFAALGFSLFGWLERRLFKL